MAALDIGKASLYLLKLGKILPGWGAGANEPGRQRDGFHSYGAYLMEERLATVKSRLGIHARPSALLVQAAAKFVSEITLAKDGLEINGKSIMGVMMLAAETGAKILVRAEGKDEADAAKVMAKMIESKFD